MARCRPDEEAGTTDADVEELFSTADEALDESEAADAVNFRQVKAFFLQSWFGLQPG
jgi:hypothetical protein